jgi:ATP-dependent DNA helicase Q1
MLNKFLMSEKAKELRRKLDNVRAQIAKLKAEEKLLVQQLEQKEEELYKERQEEKKKQICDITRNGESIWIARMYDILENTFHLLNFRENQAEIVHCTLSGHDCFVTMPTGGGKSLCYQLSALLRPGFTLIITPLVSLMQDQCFELKNLGISAAMIYASTPIEEYQRITQSMQMPPSSKLP